MVVPNMRLLIVGGNGQIGRAFCQALDKESISYYSPDKQELNLLSLQEKIVTAYDPTQIINLAGFRSYKIAEEHPSQCYALNRDGARTIARASEKIGAILIHISSWRVFDASRPQFYTETDEPNPQTVLGRSFLAGEQWVKEQCKKHIIIRLPWVVSNYGVNRLTHTMKTIKSKKPIKIRPGVVSNPITTYDAARVLVAISKQINCDDRMCGHVYHYGATKTANEREFAEFISGNIVSKENQMQKNYVPNFYYQAAKPISACLSYSKIRKTFGIQSKSWQHTIGELLASSYIGLTH